MRVTRKEVAEAETVGAVKVDDVVVVVVVAMMNVASWAVFEKLK